VWRWTHKGVHNVVLPSFCIGRKRFTTLRAFAEWCRQVTAVANGEAVQTVSGDMHEDMIDGADHEADQLLGLAPRGNDKE
jgi:hypothetical protein